MLWIDLTQFQEDLALGTVELHEVHVDPNVLIPLYGIPSLQYVDCITHLGFVDELTEDALNFTVYVTNKDNK